MTDVRRYDTAENRAYWRHAEKVAREWRENAPGWATCSRCGHAYSKHITRYACVLKPAAQEDARGGLSGIAVPGLHTERDRKD